MSSDNFKYFFITNTDNLIIVYNNLICLSFKEKMQITIQEIHLQDF